MKASLRSASELEHDASVISRLSDELGGALSALTDSDGRGEDHQELRPPALEVWVDDGMPRIQTEEVYTLAELRVGELALTMQLVGNARGETLMRAVFVLGKERELTEDVWLGIAGLEPSVAPSAFARRFRAIVGTLPRSHRDLLMEALESACRRLTTRHATILHAIYERELRDNVEQRLFLAPSDERET